MNQHRPSKNSSPSAGDATNGATDRTDTKTEDGSIFERVVPDGIKRGIEHLIRDGRFKHVIGDIKLPKEIINHMISQMDDTKRAAVQVIGREVRQFLKETNLSDELAKLLTQISFEVKTSVRFIPNDMAIKKNPNSKKNIVSTIKNSLKQRKPTDSSPPEDRPEKKREPADVVSGSESPPPTAAADSASTDRTASDK